MREEWVRQAGCVLGGNKGRREEGKTEVVR